MDFNFFRSLLYRPAGGDGTKKGREAKGSLDEGMNVKSERKARYGNNCVWVWV
jgi:hypothetical protein